MGAVVAVVVVPLVGVGMGVDGAVGMGMGVLVGTAGNMIVIQMHS